MLQVWSWDDKLNKLQSNTHVQVDRTREYVFKIVNKSTPCTAQIEKEKKQKKTMRTQMTWD